MLTDVSVVVRDALAGDGRGARGRGVAARAGLIALAVYVVIDVLWFGLDVIPHLGSTCLCQAGSDPSSYEWFLAWWPHALLHGDNPFVTDRLFAPGLTNLGAIDLVPGPALLAAPVTLLFGPVVSFNLLALLAPVLAAGCAYALCRELGADPLPAWFGGQLFGFSPYLLGHLLGHLDLLMVFPVPLTVLLVHRRLRGAISTRAYTGWLAVVLAVQLLCSLELGATLVGMGACALALTVWLVPSRRRGVLGLLGPTAIAGAIAAVVCSPFLVYGLTGPTSAGFFTNYAEQFSVDGLAPVVPTALIRIGREWFASVAASFSGNVAECEGYLGIVLVLVLGRFLVTRFGRPASRLLAALLALLWLLMLGPHLRLAGQPTIPLPWDVLQRLPLLRHAAPARLASDMFLVAAVILALWLTERRTGRRRVAKWLVAIAALALLIPNLGTGRWHTPVPSPRLFTSATVRSVVPSNAIVLTLPFAQQSYSMLWQAQTGFRYRLADGYVGALAPSGWAADLGTLESPGATPSAATLGTFLRARHVSLVLVDDADPQGWPALLAALGLHATVHDGVSVYRTGDGAAVS